MWAENWPTNQKYEILEEVLTKFDPVAVQQSLDVIRVTFRSEEDAVLARRENGIRLFGLWCRMDGGPPATIIHLFDYPYEEDEGAGEGLLFPVRLR